MIRWLEVKYPEYDYKSEYSMPILCRARDIGKVIYGKWIIGGSQYNFPANRAYRDDEENYYIAYKLVGGANIVCNFELEEGKVPCTTFGTFTDPFGYQTPEEAERLYIVDKAINNYHPVCCDPEIDSTEDGLIYIKMPSDAEEKQTNNAAEEKSTDRPQIQVGDVVRVVEEVAGEDRENCHVVSAVRWNGVYSDMPNFHYNTDIVAIYRLDGRDFKLIWESEERIARKIFNSVQAARQTGVTVEEIIAALENFAKANERKREKGK